jgi:succinate dehydrogenase / fumarate reductase cytochrome b subunit
MINNIIHGVSGYIAYRGGTGQLTFIMHRVSGLGILVFLSMHILLESTAHFAPQYYDILNEGLRSPIALVAESIMAFLVIFHGVNGFRIAYIDLFHPGFCSPPFRSQSIRITWVLSFALWLPAFILMLLHGLNVI